jgi:hypothetical protein
MGCAGDWMSWSEGAYLGANSENSQQSCGEKPNLMFT